MRPSRQHTASLLEHDMKPRACPLSSCWDCGEGPTYLADPCGRDLVGLQFLPQQLGVAVSERAPWKWQAAQQQVIHPDSTQHHAQETPEHPSTVQQPINKRVNCPRVQLLSSLHLSDSWAVRYHYRLESDTKLSAFSGEAAHSRGRGTALIMLLANNLT